jgi:cell shape-determining protein MreD
MVRKVDVYPVIQVQVPMDINLGSYYKKHSRVFSLIVFFVSKKFSMFNIILKFLDRVLEYYLRATLANPINRPSLKFRRVYGFHRF